MLLMTDTILRHAVCRDRLHEKMHVILIGTNLQEFHLVAFLNVHAHIFHHFIHVPVEDCTSVFRRKYEMVYEYRNIMAFMYIFAHLHILRRKRRGIQPEERFNYNCNFYLRS